MSAYNKPGTTKKQASKQNREQAVRAYACLFYRSFSFLSGPAMLTMSSQCTRCFSLVRPFVDYLLLVFLSFRFCPEKLFYAFVLHNSKRKRFLSFQCVKILVIKRCLQLPKYQYVICNPNHPWFDLLLIGRTEICTGRWRAIFFFFAAVTYFTAF